MVTMHWADLVMILTLVAGACGASYLLLLRRMRQLFTEHHLMIADQQAHFDEAIRTLETRLSKAQMASGAIAAVQDIADATSQNDLRDHEQSEEVAPDIRAVIAAAAVAAFGQNIHIRSIGPATSSWSQQGRVLVQASHNARARR